MVYPKWLIGLVPVLVAMHLNYWMWNDARLVWGFPANLFYHLLFSFFLFLVMLFVVRRGWPRYLDED